MFCLTTLIWATWLRSASAEACSTIKIENLAGETEKISFFLQFFQRIGISFFLAYSLK
jgi:hypothetical protein